MAARRVAMPRGQAVARRQPAGYAVGDVLDGRFEILQLLGEGSFARAYRVLDDIEGRERTLKLFDYATGEEAARREIGVLRKIRHPNVVEVFWADKTNAGTSHLTC
jgi:serine/threonine protein kinase